MEEKKTFSRRESVQKYLLEDFWNVTSQSEDTITLQNYILLFQKLNQDFNRKALAIKNDINLLLGTKISDFRCCTGFIYYYNSDKVMLSFDHKRKATVSFSEDGMNFSLDNLAFLSSLVNDIRNLYIEYANLHNLNVEDLVSSNSRFFISINNFGGKAFLKRNDGTIIFAINFDDQSCDNTLMAQNIQIKIDDLPEWIQDAILSTRKKPEASSPQKRVRDKIRSFFGKE